MFDTSILREAIRTAFPNRNVARFALLSGGLINTNYRVDFENGSPVVLRVYRDGPRACRKELAIHQLIRSNVAVAEIIHAKPDGVQDLSAFAVLEYIDGLTFQQLKHSNDREAISQAAYSVGQTLGAIGRFEFSQPGNLLATESGELIVGERFIKEGETISTLLDAFLNSEVLQQRAGFQLVERIHRFGSSWEKHLLALDEQHRMVHCDFGNRNLLVREVNARWCVAAVLDWEVAISGSPLLDVGHFLRYERDETRLREPNFSRGFVENGGELPPDWRRMCRAIDLTALVECLTHRDLPTSAEAEILGLIQATLRECIA